MKINKPPADVLHLIDSQLCHAIKSTDNQDHAEVMAATLWSHRRLVKFVGSLLDEGFLYGNNLEKAKKFLAEIGERD
jgi:hypothetical protein